ncbi:MAG: NYN domain-containing protein [Elusimicrobiales bacterium]|nr:NYN domain-containing protein [Elusimicrobiales bacterium]
MANNGIKKKALILIDDSNFYYGFKKQSWEMDYEKFYKWLNDNFCPIAIYFFGGIIAKKAFFDRHPTRHPTHTLADFIKAKKEREAFFKKLKSIGYKVATKLVSSVYDYTSGTYKRKCNFDVEMTIIALDRLNEYEELVLCSGDGDFTKLLKYIKGKYKKATVIAHKDRLNFQLKEAANRIIFIEDIKKEVENKKGLP